jgi:hypothetical protein
MGGRGLTEAQIKARYRSQEDKISEWVSLYGDKYDYSEVEYVDFQTPVKITCNLHNVSFTQRAGQHHFKEGCPQCRTERTKELYNKRWDDYRDKIDQAHNGNYDFCRVKKYRVNDRNDFGCKKHGTWFKQANVKALAGKTGCPECKKEGSNLRQRKGNDDIIKEFREIHGDKYDYSKVDYYNRSTPVIITCPSHGEFTQTPMSHKRTIGCPRCAYELGYEKYRKPVEDFKTAFEKSNPNYECDYSTYKGVNYKVKMKCKIHGVTFEANAGKTRKPMLSCPVCRKIGCSGYTHLDKMKECDKNAPCSIYHVRFTHIPTGHQFDKVGVTRNSVERRMQKRKMEEAELTFETLEIFNSTLEDCLIRERRVQEDMFQKGLSYREQYLKKTSIGGWTECYPVGSFKLSDYI